MSETRNGLKTITPKAELLQNVEDLIKTLDPRPQGALMTIRDEERRVLAVRQYFRFSKAELDKKWAWSDVEMTRFMKSDDRLEAEAKIKAVIRAFEKLSKDQVSLMSAEPRRLIRTLHVQIGFWNGNQSVHYLGEQLIEKLLNLSPHWTGKLDLFKKYLTGHGPHHQVELEEMTIKGAGKKGEDLKIKRSPTHATPGLSDHGRASAFDFIVIRKSDRQVVAGTVTKSIPEKWDRAGYTDMLKQAVFNAGNHFEGPLGAPKKGIYEPWHYVYHRSP
jgi:hypothetical protein